MVRYRSFSVVNSSTDVSKNGAKFNSRHVWAMHVCVCVLLPQLAKVRQDSTGIEVVCNHADARSQAGLNVRSNNKPRLHGLLSQQTCQSQHRLSSINNSK